MDPRFDYERLRGPTDRTTFQVFVGYRTDRLRWGFQYDLGIRPRTDVHLRLTLFLGLE